MGASVRRERLVSMRSPVNWTVLGLVIERSSYGYELATRYERLYGDVMPISNESNIYTALNVLRQRGLIEVVPGSHTVEPDSRRQPKPHYRATQEGLAAYEAWVIAQMREHHRRSREFARQLGAFAQQPQIALGILARYEQACLDEKGAAIPTASEFPSRVVPGLGESLASAYGRAVVAATLSWVQYARREFAALASRQVPGK
jgi:DNA-binding PadR family transcriptional regulator